MKWDERLCIMSTSKQEDVYKKRLEYLLITLESAEKRRTAVENKSSILLAANAIILASMLSLGFPSVSDIHSYLDLIRISLLSVTLGCVFLSILFCSRVLSGYTTDKWRGNIMDIKDEYNVFFVGKIADRSKEEYLKEVGKLTDKRILEQIGAEIHNVSRIVRDRYRYFNGANIFFIVSVISFAGLVIAQFIKQ